MKLVFKHFRPYLPLVILLVLVLFGQAICELLLPGFMSNIINNGIVKQNMPIIKQTGLEMLLLAFASMALSVISVVLASKVSAGGCRDIRRSLFNKVTSFSDAEMDKFSTASLITRSTNDIQTVQQTTVIALRMVLFAPVMGVGALILALRTCTKLSWILIVALLAIVAVMIVVFALALPKFKAMQKLLDKVNLLVGERLSGLLVIRAFNSEMTEQERFNKTNKELRRINLFINKMMSLLFPLVTAIMCLVSLAIVWFGAAQINTGGLTLGDMLAYIQYGMHVIISFIFITIMFIMLPRAFVSMQRINDVLAVDATITDKDGASDAKVSGDIVFDNVSFAFPDAEENVLADISFTAPIGKTTAIIGSTGSGKSTLINLIPRFYDVTGGKITIGGKDIRDLTLKNLRDIVGFVPQKSVLFTGTIASNLEVGKENATPEEMRRAAEIAQALDFIEASPNGFDTVVAQGGTSLSGGQKQRLAIARAVIKEPKVLIFDDSFSALDFETDKALRCALKENLTDCTTLIVAQRINTIIDADQIITLDDEGRIAGIGTHKELLESCAVYKEIALSQLSDEDLRKEGI